MDHEALANPQQSVHHILSMALATLDKPDNAYLIDDLRSVILMHMKTVFPSIPQAQLMEYIGKQFANVIF